MLPAKGPGCERLVTPMPAAGFENLRVLIVEDNAHMRALLRALLNSAGIKQIVEAGNGQSALGLLREHQSDLVLTDLAMKPMDGLEFTRHVRNNEQSPNPFVPIIMITGHTERYRVEAARDAGVTEFLAKPITAQNLFARIAEIVERPRAFVRCDTYFGPDRRRHTQDDYAGPWRRKDDFQQEVDVR
jgi:two-component system chemotaxis response regulator CheY